MKTGILRLLGWKLASGLLLGVAHSVPTAISNVCAAGAIFSLITLYKGMCSEGAACCCLISVLLVPACLCGCDFTALLTGTLKVELSSVTCRV